jgi:hypothetical protein
MVKDRLNQDLKLGDLVVYVRPYWHDLGVGKIVKFTPKKIRVQPHGKKYTDLVYSNSLVLADETRVMFALLAGNV